MTLEKIQELIIEYYKLADREHIENYLEEVFLVEDFLVTRRSLKHIVEQRRKDKYTEVDISNIFIGLHDTILSKNFTIKESESSSFILIGNTTLNATTLVVAVERSGEIKIIKTAFMRASTKAKRLIK